MGNLLIMTVAAYLVGAIPFALLIARIKGVDIRTVGSGNVGATNVFRAVGKGYGVLTFVCDVVKGYIPAALFPLALATGLPPEQAGLLYGCAAIAGHNWPVYLRFKGGKGVATSAGVLLGVAPVAVGVGVAAWAILFVLARYVSLASIGAALTIPVTGWIIYGTEQMTLSIVLTVLGAVVIWRHRGNIGRLINGTEHQFRVDKKPTPPSSDAASDRQEPSP